MQDLSEIQEVYDEGRDDSECTDVELLRCRSSPASPPTPSLSFACDSSEDCGDPEDDWWLGWALKIQHWGLP
jgi:hypothetical protein